MSRIAGFPWCQNVFPRLRCFTSSGRNRICKGDNHDQKQQIPGRTSIAASLSDWWLYLARKARQGYRTRPRCGGSDAYGTDGWNWWAGITLDTRTENPRVGTARLPLRTRFILPLATGKYDFLNEFVPFGARTWLMPGDIDRSQIHTKIDLARRFSRNPAASSPCWTLVQ